MTRPFSLYLIKKKSNYPYHHRKTKSRIDGTIGHGNPSFKHTDFVHLKTLQYSMSTPYFLVAARYSPSNFSILGPQRSPLQSPLPEPMILLISGRERAPALIAAITILRGNPLHMQTFSFCSSHCLLIFSESLLCILL